jgi:hypothetical protein
MTRSHAIVVHRAILLLAVLAASACARVASVPPQLRAREFQLIRVDGKAVRGARPFSAPVGSRAEAAECQDRVADGNLSISKDGRSFTYHSTLRDCTGAVLVSEANEGTLEARGDSLVFLIEGNAGAVSFRGVYADSTITVLQLGGRLEFVRR